MRPDRHPWSAAFFLFGPLFIVALALTAMVVVDGVDGWTLPVAFIRLALVGFWIFGIYLLCAPKEGRWTKRRVAILVVGAVAAVVLVARFSSKELFDWFVDDTPAEMPAVRGKP